MTTRQATSRISSMEGLRAVAALGIVATHVAFQTGIDPATALGAILARFDFFVAVFFALSAFLLWRRHSADTSFREYALRRAVRILPAYWVTVVAVLLLLPIASGTPPLTGLATMLFAQLFIPDGLAPGLTHLWSMVVEVAFYLVLPVLALTVGRMRSTWARLATIVVLAAVSLGWGFLPFVQEAEVNAQIWPPAYASWYAVGMNAAECERAGWRPRALRHHWIFLVLALGIAWLAGQEWVGPLGLTHPAPRDFARRILLGAAFAAAVVVPYALQPSSRILSSAPAQAFGRWSYSIFLWHVAALGVVFPLLGIPLFSGSWVHFGIVFLATLALTLPVAAASYLFVEEPAMSMAARAAAEKRRRSVESPA